MTAWELVGLCMLCLMIGFLLGAVWFAMRAGISLDDDR